MKVLVTGGCGFIGSAACRLFVRENGWAVVNLDALTYAADPNALSDLDGDPGYAFERADIRDRAALDRILEEHRPDAVAHLAAETHVDRSIDGPDAFVSTNVVGATTLLAAVAAYRDKASRGVRMLHVSTDEVYGSLSPGEISVEGDAYRPNSPYAASKAAADHFARAWTKTYGLDVVVSNCGNNYGPRQFPEKLIPLMIAKGLAGEALPVYGDGLNERDWIHVDDHARALAAILQRGATGETYNVGAQDPRTNLDVVRAICAGLDKLRPDAAPHDRLISFVADRPGHDRRYALDAARLRAATGWSPRIAFEQGLEETVLWYADNRAWMEEVSARRYGGERLGLA